MTTIHVVDYAPEHEAAASGLMAELQDFERALSHDRSNGAQIARDHLAYLLSLCARHSGKLFVALDGEEVIGFAVVFLESEDEDDEHLLPEFKRYGWLSDLYVKPGHRGTGVATRLLQRCERHCAGLGVRQLRLSTLAANAGARRFYENAGYSERDVVYVKDV